MGELGFLAGLRDQPVPEQLHWFERSIRLNPHQPQILERLLGHYSMDEALQSRADNAVAVKNGALAEKQAAAGPDGAK